MKDNLGQGTVEAAVVIPVLFLLLLLLLQPGIVLYDRIVMGNAAAEGCRLLATGTDSFGPMSRSCEAFVRHRLAAVPPHDCFHVHEGGCSWDIQLSGSETSETVTVQIGNRFRPLPLFDAGAKLAGMTDSDGTIRIEESVTLPTQPSWAGASQLGMNPSGWIGGWLE